MDILVFVLDLPIGRLEIVLELHNREDNYTGCGNTRFIYMFNTGNLQSPRLGVLFLYQDLIERKTPNVESIN